MTKVVIHTAGLNHLLRDPLGPLGLYIDRKAREVEVRAKHNASGVGRPNVRSTQLYASIRYSGLFVDARGLVAAIGTDARSPRKNFNYPMALEAGMPGPAGELPTRQGAFGRSEETQSPYRYPFLRPALWDTFGQPWLGTFSSFPNLPSSNAFPMP